MTSYTGGKIDLATAAATLNNLPPFFSKCIFYINYTTAIEKVFVCVCVFVFVFVVVFVIVFVFVFVSSYDFWVAFIISFQNMYG